MKKIKKKKQPKTPVQIDVEYVNKLMGYKTLIKPPKYWLDTGFPRLNAVLGSKKYGLASGKIYLIAGKESSGKSVLAAKLAGLAQSDNFDVAWVDGENSYDPRHVRRQGLHTSRVQLFYPEFGIFKGRKKKGRQKESADELAKVEPAEYLFTRVELWMRLKRKENPDGKLFIVVDSTNSFSPMEEQDAGYTDQNMRTKVSSAVFLNQLTKRLSPLAVHTNAIVILISQLRTNPGQMFGNPDYIPGGGGLKFYPSSIVWMRRVKDGAIKSGDKQIGVKGLLTNTKNKVGRGSIERKKAGYLVHFFKDKWKFVSSQEIKGE